MAEKEYIERGAVVDYLNKVSEETDNWYEEDAQERPENLICYFKSIPAADVVEVRHGEWISVDEETTCDEWDCTACGERKTFLCEMDEDDMREYYKHCPNCGAKMDGGKTE